MTPFPCLSEEVSDNPACVCSTFAKLTLERYKPASGPKICAKNVKNLIYTLYMPQIEVTFDIDANGIVNVSAKDLGTGTEQHITITSSSNMSKDDIEKAVKEAEQYAAEDAKIKEKVEVRNQADQMVYQSEKTLSEVGDKLPESEKAPIQAGIDKLKETLKGEDTDAIKAATEELTQLFYKMSEKLYQQQAPQGDPTQAGQQGGAQGDQGGQYYDADYKVVDDDDTKNK